MTADPKALAATGLLAVMLSGIPHRGDEDDLTFSLSELRSEGSTVYTTVVLPSGDQYRVSVAWDSEASP